jgi:hypothetical protein
VITGRQASCSSPATTDRHEHRPTQITAGRLRRSLAAPQHTPAPGRPGTYKRGTAGLSLLRRLSHGVALLSQCVTRVCCRISLYGIKTRRLRQRAPTGNPGVAWPGDRNHDTARGPAGRARSRPTRPTRVGRVGRCAATVDAMKPWITHTTPLHTANGEAGVNVTWASGASPTGEENPHCRSPEQPSAAAPPLSCRGRSASDDAHRIITGRAAPTRDREVAHERGCRIVGSSAAGTPESPFPSMGLVVLTEIRPDNGQVVGGAQGVGVVVA